MVTPVLGWRLVRSLRNIEPINFWREVFQILNATSLSDSQTTIEGLITNLETTIENVLDNLAPLTRKKIVNRTINFRLSRATLKLKKQMRLSEQAWRRSKLNIHRDIYKTDRNSYLHALRKEKECQFRRKLVHIGENSRQVWRQLAEITGNCLKQSRIKMKQSLPSDSTVSRAQCLADFFSNKVTTIVNSLAPEILQGLPVDCPNFRVNGIMINFNAVTFYDVKKELSNLPAMKKSPLDALPPGFLRQSDEFLLYAAQLCNISFSSGTFPDCLKLSQITPVPKKVDGDLDDLANFRPNSNIKILGKLFEKLAAVQLVAHIEKENYLHCNQSAYRKGYSTETATLSVFSDWCEALDCSRVVIIGSLDVSAAFDTVNHDILLYRLMQAGVMGLALKWFSSYLKNRQGIVKVGDNTSQSFLFSSGVP